MTDQELIREVVIKVMGWAIKIRDFPRPGHCWIYDKDGNEVMALYKFNPLTNPAHWMMVVERMRELGWLFKCGNVVYPSGGNEPDVIEYFVAFYKKFSLIDDPYEWPEFHHQNLGHAVCEASIKAVETK